MTALETLLSNRWIVKEKNKEKYYKIKDEIGPYKKFCIEKLGYQLIVNPYLIKLEKLPAKAEPWMGIAEFNDKRQYVFLCLILMYLEDMEADEQFVLSSLTEYITAAWQVEPIDWTLYSYRRHLIRTLRYCIDEGLIRVDDGSVDKFMDDHENEVLYSNTGIARYFMKNFTRDIMEYSQVSDFEKSEWIDINEERGAVRRQRVYRKLLMTPAVYKEGDGDEDFAYIRNFRNILEDDLDNYFDCDLHLNKTSAYAVLREGSGLGKGFPGENTLSHIVLLCCAMFRDLIGQNQVELEPDETAVMSAVLFQKTIEACKAKWQDGFAKFWREKTSSDFYRSIKDFMEDHGMIRLIDGEKNVVLMPILGKVIGKYPDRFIEDRKKGEDIE